mmetsp:Transcript_15930/g.33433  ORF Transcript_15930/g.33433 Transcript_15930/m.33433 type:complete len:206 (+) Transcript_15930:2330-2947(+)
MTWVGKVELEVVSPPGLQTVIPDPQVRQECVVLRAPGVVGPVWMTISNGSVSRPMVIDRLVVVMAGIEIERWTGIEIGTGIGIGHATEAMVVATSQFPLSPGPKTSSIHHLRSSSISAAPRGHVRHRGPDRGLLPLRHQGQDRQNRESRVLLQGTNGTMATMIAVDSTIGDTTIEVITKIEVITIATGITTHLRLKIGGIITMTE